MVFAHLIISDTFIHHVIEYLTSATLPSGQKGLNVLVTQWMENYASFSGYYQLKVSAYALARLYERHDVRLESLLVKGDVIDTHPGRNFPLLY